VKILICTADYPPLDGDMSTVSARLARALAALGHDVAVVAPRFPGIKGTDAAEPAEVVRYRGYRSAWLRLMPMLVTSWRSARGCDAVLALNVASGGVCAMLLRAMRGTPYVVFACGHDGMTLRNAPVLGGLLRRVYARAKAIVADSEFTRGNLVNCGVDADRIDVVWPGADPGVRVDKARVDAARYDYVLDGSRVILSVGRLSMRNNHVALVRALPGILERVPNTVLLIAGRGPCMGTLCQEARRLGVRNQLVLPGEVGEARLAALYAACDVFALPVGVGGGEQADGLGLAVSEAHAHAKPVVAGNSGAAPELVLDGETGLLVESDEPGAIAGALLRILEDPGLATRLGRNGRKRVEDVWNGAAFARRVAAILERPA